MTIREAIATTLVGYGSAKLQTLAGHALVRVARPDFPDAVRAAIPEERYLIEGSAGQGQWAEVPWVAFFDWLITNTARQGFYIVHLFRSDLSGVYLYLNQGVTSEMFTARMEARDVSVRSSVFLPKPAEKERYNEQEFKKHFDF
jgi:5-methylcytosine-specific restriction enzyme A